MNRWGCNINYIAETDVIRARTNRRLGDKLAAAAENHVVDTYTDAFTRNVIQLL
jgi:hypothetical protein